MLKRWTVVLLCLLVILSACSPPEDSQTDLDQNEAKTEAEEEAVSEVEAPPESTPTAAPATETALPEVVHWEYPGEFTPVPLQRIFDCVLGKQVLSGNELALNTACDQWERNYFERPVAEDMADFYPQLDIVQSEFGADEEWYYNRILLFSDLEDPLVLDGVYALEIDLNLDARGDILILAASPGSYPADEWHSNGVQVWADNNDDVGGPQAVLVDPRYDGDGYETLLVDSGIGQDPDLAYVKTYSDQPGLVEFAFRISLLDSQDVFEWWVWAMAEDISAAKFDPVDFFPEDSLYAMDNTCGWILGSYPRDLPNICETISAPTKPVVKDGVCKPDPSYTPDPCQYWDKDSCSWKWDYACFN